MCLFWPYKEVHFFFLKFFKVQKTTCAPIHSILIGLLQEFSKYALVFLGLPFMLSQGLSQLSLNAEKAGIWRMLFALWSKLPITLGKIFQQFFVNAYIFSISCHPFNKVCSMQWPPLHFPNIQSDPISQVPHVWTWPSWTSSYLGSMLKQPYITFGVEFLNCNN